MQARTSQTRQQQAFAEERARWAAAGQTAAPRPWFSTWTPPRSAAEAGIPEGCEAVTSPMASKRVENPG